MFDHLINGKEIRKKNRLFGIRYLIINREKDRNAKLVIRMEGKSTFITDFRLTCKFNSE